MDPAPSITELLHELQRSEKTTSDIYNYFIDEARRVAKIRLSMKLKNRVTPSTIAHEALDECIKRSKNISAEFISRDDFGRMLNKQIRRRLSNAGERATTKTRDIAREVSGDNAVNEATQGNQPLDEIVTGEMAIKVVHCIFEEPDEMRRSIAVLGILLSHKAKDIREMIKPLAQGDANAESPPTQYSIQAIQRIIKKRRDILKKRLGGDEDDGSTRT